jgi:hypothetical protein
MALDGHLHAGPGVAACVGGWIYWLALWEYLRGGGWRPDRSNLFGPEQWRQLPAITRPVDIPVQQLLLKGLPDAPPPRSPEGPQGSFQIP